MKRVELGLKEAAALLGYSEEAVVQLVYSDQLVAEYSGDELRVSLDSIVRFVGVGAEQTAVRGLRQVLEDREAWRRVFVARPEHSASDYFEQFPGGPVGQSLRRAIAISEIRGA